MKKKPPVQVSIITPSYNQGNFLEETIQSVLTQTYSNIEYLVIDGGSSDNSVDIIKKYEPNISYWISENDNGQADAINKGLKLATGSLLCWVNSDDTLYPDYVTDRVRQFENNPNIGMIYGDVDQGITPAAKRIRKGIQTDINQMLKSTKCPIPQQSAMWRRIVIETIGYLDPQWHVLLDREYFTRIAAHYKIKYISGSVGFFRNHNQSKSVAEKLTWADELPKYYEMVFNDNIYDLTPDLLANENICLSKIYLKCGKMLAKDGNKVASQEFFMKSKQTNFFTYLFNHSLRFRFPKRSKSS